MSGTLPAVPLIDLVATITIGVGMLLALALLAEPKLSDEPRRVLLVAFIAAVSSALSTLPAPAGAPTAPIGLAIVVGTVMLWATQVIPGWLSCLAFFAAALITAAAPPLKVLSGFWSNAAALVVGGLLLGTAAERSGLGRLVAHGLVRRFVTSYPMFLAGILIGAGALSFLVPATMGRLALTIPVVAATAKEAGYEPGSRGYIGAMVTTVAGNFLTSYSILTANLINIIATGSMESLHGPLIHYGEYLTFAMPVLGLVKGLTFWAIMVALCRPPAPLPTQAGDAPVLTGAGRRLALIIGVTVLVWVTDFVHGLPAGWVALTAGLLCLLPGVDLVPPRDAFDWGKVNAILPLAATLGIGSVLAHSGAGAVIGAELTRVAIVEGATPAYGFLAIATLTSLVSALATTVGAIAIMTPVIGEIATATGLSMKLALMAEITGLQAVFFPYQTVPVMVGFAIARVPIVEGLKLILPMGVVGLLLITPLNMLWLRLIGALP